MDLVPCLYPLDAASCVSQQGLFGISLFGTHTVGLARAVVVRVASSVAARVVGARLMSSAPAQLVTGTIVGETSKNKTRSQLTLTSSNPVKPPTFSPTPLFDVAGRHQRAIHSARPLQQPRPLGPGSVVGDAGGKTLFRRNSGKDFSGSTYGTSCLGVLMKVVYCAVEHSGFHTISRFPANAAPDCVSLHRRILLFIDANCVDTSRDLPRLVASLMSL